MALEAILRRAPVVPVLVIESVADAVPLAKALIAGGLPVLEITLRTSAAFDCIRAIMAECETAIVGGGTVVDAEQFGKVEKLGCAFAVSPGSTPRLLDAAAASPVPLLPGAASATEAMILAERGYRSQKFFPAEAFGGAAYLSALASPLPQISFCPTGGITAQLAPSYLALPNVVAIGGSWMAPKQLVAAGDWAGIEALARAAAALRS